MREELYQFLRNRAVGYLETVGSLRLQRILGSVSTVRRLKKGIRVKDSTLFELIVRVELYKKNKDRLIAEGQPMVYRWPLK